MLHDATVNAEQHVIGAMLIATEAIDAAVDLNVGDFVNQSHRMLFAAIRDMHAVGRPVDVVTVSEAMERSGSLNDVGGLAYIGALAQNVPTAANAGHYAKLVAAAATKRRLAVAGAAIVEMAAMPGAGDVDDMIDAARRRIEEAAGVQASDEVVVIGDIIGSLIDVLEARMDHDGELPGLSTGLTDLDSKLLGLRGGDLVIVAGRPSMGKTTLAMQIALHNALVGKTVLVFSLEMTPVSLTERALASIKKVDTTALRKGRLQDEDWDKIAASIPQFQKMPLHLDGSSSITVERMRARSKRLKAQRGLDLVVLDYIQLMGAEGQNRNEEISKISRGLKLLAKELGVPVIALSQLSRKCEERTNKRPLLSDLRDSGAIEQDADVVLTVYRDEFYHPESDAQGIAEIGIAKNRDGETGSVYAAFIGHHNRFENAFYTPKPKAVTPIRRGFTG